MAGDGGAWLREQCLLLAQNNNTGVPFWLSLPLTEWTGWIQANNSVAHRRKNQNSKAATGQSRPPIPPSAGLPSPESLYRTQRHEKDVGRLVELKGSIDETGAALAEAAVKADELQAEFDRMAAEGSDVFGIQQELYAYQIKVKELTDLLAEEEDEYNRLTGSVNEYSEAQRQAADSAGTMPAVLSDTRAEMDLLSTKYGEAYKDAYESINGQMGLFEKMSVKVNTSTGDMITALKSQASYMTTYSENLRKAAEMGLSEGLLAQLSDGSTQSAAYLQAIVKGGEKQVKELNAAFAKVAEGKENFSNTVAEMQIGFGEAMDTMEQDVLEGIQAMDLSSEAAESARSTIQAYIDQAEAMEGPLRTAFAGLWQGALDTLALEAGSRYVEPMTGAERRDRGFASGTDNAPPGWAWVGEEGPELIHMRGGETVLPAEVSRRFAALSAESAELTNTNVRKAEPLQVFPMPAAAGANSFQLVFHLDGNTSPETVEFLRTYVEGPEFRERVREVFAEEQADAVRRAMW